MLTVCLFSHTLWCYNTHFIVLALLFLCVFAGGQHGIWRSHNVSPVCTTAKMNTIFSVLPLTPRVFPRSLTFSAPGRYWQLTPSHSERAAWDSAVHQASEEYSHRMVSRVAYDETRSLRVVFYFFLLLITMPLFPSTHRHCGCLPINAFFCIILSMLLYYSRSL